MHVDEIQFQIGKASLRKRSHVICELRAVDEGLSCEEQTYYAHSINTMRVVEVDKLFSKNDKLYFSVQVC